MNKLTLKQYLAFHINLNLQINQQSGDKLLLKKIIKYPNDKSLKKEVIQITTDQELIKNDLIEYMLICEVRHVDDVLKNKEIIKALKNHIEIDLAPAKNGVNYLNQLLKVGKKEEVLYFILNVYQIDLKKNPLNYTEKVLKNIINHPDGMEIIKEVLSDRNILTIQGEGLKEINLQLKIKQILNQLNKELKEIKLGFQKMFLSTSKGHIIALLNEAWKEDKFYKNQLNFLKEWIPYLNERKDVVEIINEFFDEIKVNDFEEYYQIKVRDIILEFFSDHLHQFEWINLLYIENASIFKTKEVLHYIPIEIGIKQLQKSCPVKYGTTNYYCNALEILKETLPKIKELNIHEVYSQNLIETDETKEKWMIILNQPSQTMENDIQYLIIEYFTTYMPSLNLFNEMKDEEIMRVKSFKEMIEEDNLIQWIQSYWLNYNLEKNLTVNTNSNHQSKI